MPLRRNRFTGFMVLLFSIALISLAAGVFFYVKLEQNESFQTQLHLRELQRVAKSLEDSIASIQTSISTDIKLGKATPDPNDTTKSAPHASAPSDLSQLEPICTKSREFCALGDHLKTAFPNLVAEPPQKNASDNSAKTCGLPNESLAIVAGAAGACAVDEQATLISQNFYLTSKEGFLDSRRESSPINKETTTNASGNKFPLASRYIARIKIPLDDLAKASSLMPLVILTDEEGNRIHSWHNVRTHAKQSSIHYRSAAALLQKLKLKQSGTSTTGNTEAAEGIGYSDFVDLEIAGESYRAYVMPWRKVPYFADDSKVEDCQPENRNTNGCDQAGTGSSNYYLIGLQPSSSLLGSKLSISHSIVVLLVLAALAFIALLPAIKLQLVSPQQAFTPADRQALIFGSLAFIALLALSGYHFILYSGLKDQLDTQANKIHQQISSRFEAEIATWRELAEIARKADIETDRIRQGSATEQASRVADIESQHREPKSGRIFQCEDSRDLLLPPEAFGEYSFIEGTFILGEDGKFDVGSWSHARHCRPGTEIILTHRSYYKHGMNCTGWRMGDVTEEEKNSECRGRYHIERVLNVRDSRLNTWLSLPLFDTPSIARARAEGDRSLLVFGGRLQTLIKPVLPLHFSYLVFDNATGEVQYHSDDQANSLVDNIYVDTDNNNYLSSLIDLNQETPQIFSGLYKGEEYVFSAGRIIQTVPWTLLVMYEKAAFRNINMLSVFSTLLLVLLLMTLAWVLCLLLPGDRRYRLFQPLKFDRSLHTRDYLLRSALLLLLLCLLLIPLFSYDLLYILLLGPIASITLVVLMGFRRWRPHSRRPSRQVSPARPLEPGGRRATAYTLYILLLLINAVVLPVLVVSEQSYRFFLTQHIALMSFDLTAKIDEAKRERRHYIDSFIDPDETGLKKTKEHHRSAELLRCHLGDERHDKDELAPRCGSDNGFATTAFQYTDDMVKVVQHIPTATDTGVMAKLWQWMNLKLDATSDFEVLAQKATPGRDEGATGARLYWFNPNLPRFYKTIGDDHYLWVLLAALVIVLLPYWLLRTRVLSNLFGLQLPDNFRSPPAGRPGAAYNGGNADLSRHMAAGLLRTLDNYRSSDQEPVYIQIIRPGTQTRTLFFDVEASGDSTQPSAPAAPAGDKQDLGLDNLSLLTRNPLDLNALIGEQFVSPEEALEPYLNSTGPAPYPTLVLRGLEHIPLNPARRKHALRLLQYLVAKRSMNLILLADVSPLYRFTHPEAYPYKLDQEALPNSEEQIAWAALFRRFTKIYDWVPAQRTGRPGTTAWDTFVREHQGWPELQRIGREFLAYHCAEKDHGYLLPVALEDLDQMVKGSGSDPDAPHSRCATLARSINHHWTTAQVVDFFGTAAVAHYRYRWELCTTQERLLLTQLAHDNIPNPRNTVPVQHLLRRGYLYHQEGWRLANDSFRDFILHAEDPATVRRWIGDANESIWKYARIPIFIVLLSLLGLIAYSAAEAFQSFLGIAAAVLGLLPLLLRNISLIRSQPSAES